MSNASTIAADIITQLAAQSWVEAVPYTIAYRRMYLDALENLPAAGTPESKLKITIAPAAYDPARTGWGGGRLTSTLGIICEKLVKDPDDDTELDPLETFAENLAALFIGPRQFAEVWNAEKPKAIFGDDYIDDLYGNRRFFVPIIVDFFCDVGVN